MTVIAINPALQPLGTDDLLALAAHYARVSQTPHEDRPYRDEVLERIERAAQGARCSGVVTEYIEPADVIELAKFLDD